MILISVITLIVCVGLFVVFRVADKNNRSLEKVSNYTERAKKEFDDYIQQRMNQLQNAAVDLDTKQNMSVAAVKRLEQLYDDFSKQAINFEEKNNALQKIEKRISDYDKSLSELSQMTTNVEENLLRIKKESSIIDKLDGALKNQKKAIEDVAKRLPALEQDFAKKNAADLEAIRANLLNQFQQESDAIAQSTSLAVSKNEEILQHINNIFEQAYENASAHADKLEGGAFEKLNKKAEERVKKYTTIIEDKTAALHEAIKQKITEGQNLVKKYNEQWSSETNSLIESLKKEISEETGKLKIVQEKSASTFDHYENSSKELNDRISEEIGSAQEKLKDLQNRLDAVQNIFDSNVGGFQADLENTVSSLQAKMDTSITTIEENITSRLSTVEEEVAGRLTTVEEKVENCFTSIEDNLENRVATINEKMDTNINTLEQKLDGDIGAMEEKIDSTMAKMEVQLDNNSSGLNTRISNDLEEIEKNLTSSIENLKNVFDSEIESAKTDFHKELNVISVDVSSQAEKMQALLENESVKLDKQCEDVVKNLSANHEAKAQDYFSKIDQQLDSYRQDIVYRLEQLSTISSDMDEMERNVRKAMDETSKRVLADFQIFTKSQQNQQNEVAQRFQDDAEALSEKMHGLEGELTELKQKAYDNVSEKLDGFQDSFFDDLQKRGEDINDKLEEWQSGFDGKLDSITSKLEIDQKEAEEKCMEDINQRLLQITKTSIEQFERLEKNVISSGEDLQSKLQGLEDSIQLFNENSKKELENAKSALDTYFKEEYNSYIAEVNDKIAQEQNVLNDKMADLSTRVKESSEQTDADIETLRNDFNKWKERLEAQLVETNDIFTEKANTLEAKATSMIENVETNFQENMQAYNNETEQKIRQFKTLLQESTDKATENQQTMVLNVQNKTNELNKAMDDLDKRLKDFIKDSGIIDKAVKQKNELQEKIAILQTEISKVDDYKKQFASFDSQLQALRKSEEDVTQKVAKFNANKKQIDSMEATFNKLIALSGTIDGKLAEMQNTGDQLEALQLDIRQAREKATEVANKYERLEGKSELLDSTIEDISKAFDGLRSIEQHLNECEAQFKELPLQVETLQKDIDKLLKSSPKLNDAVEKISNLKDIVEETDSRIEKLQDSRSWLAETETRLQEVSTKTQSQLQLLGQISSAGKTSHDKDKGAPSPSTKENVVELKRLGWKDKEIASKLGLSVSEVQLILEMPR